MDEKEITKLKDAYDTAAMKYLSLKNELRMLKEPIMIVGASTPHSAVPEPSYPEKEEAVKMAYKDLDKASTAYFDMLREYRAELLPKGYREEKMQIETTFDELCDDETLEESEETPNFEIVAIPEQKTELPICHRQVYPVNVTSSPQ